MPSGSESGPVGIGRRPGAWTLAVASVASALLLGSSSAGAHPDHLVEPIDVENLGYAPAAVTIREGSTVAWRWQNSTPHSVTSAPGSAVQFDSGLQVDGDPSFLIRFDEVGTFDYFSKGSPGIEGTIEVEPLPGKAPVIRGLEVRGGSKPKAKFRLNTDGFLLGRIQRRKKSGEWRTRTTVSRGAKKGRNKVRLPRQKLKRGRYRLKLTVYDRYAREDTALSRFRLR